ncbi:hypothetical protein ABH922_003839 [Rhodococcus sp. 27YEA15]|uniref:hypothetical protein n=1 Tax=Rhodococcus sp. 27YEA15 TaxID=3156259 RepID=UPI003C7E4F52
MPRQPARHLPGYRDRQQDWDDHFDRTRRREIAALIDDDVTTEHQLNPIGYRACHSWKLQRVLNYMRVQPVLGKYFVYPEKAWEKYRIAVIHERGHPPVVLDEHIYRSEEEAMHAIFLLRAEEIVTSVKEHVR